MLRTEATGIFPKKAKKLLLNGEEQGVSSDSDDAPRLATGLRNSFCGST
jgi:hypothetical protein